MTYKEFIVKKTSKTCSVTHKETGITVTVGVFDSYPLNLSAAIDICEEKLFGVVNKPKKFQAITKEADKVQEMLGG